MRDPTSDIAVEQAFAHHRAGRRAEAEALCRAVLEKEPGHAGATHLLAVMAHAQKRLGLEEKPAVQTIRSASAISPATSAITRCRGSSSRC